MTFTRANGLTSCDTCHALVATWREKSEHDGAHVRGAQLAARQARIDAQTRCNTPRFEARGWAETDRIKGTNEATSDLTPKPPLHPDATEYKMKSSARQAVPPLTFRGVV